MRECSSECLAWNTMILMADGSEKRISEICIGESVMLNTGKKVRINNIYTGREDTILNIMTSHGKIRVTGSHPILLIGAKWTKADVLKSGDIVCTLSGDAKVVSVEQYSVLTAMDRFIRQAYDKENPNNNWDYHCR